MNKSVFRQVRFALYAAFLLNGVLVQWVLPLDFRCSVTGEHCFACGLRGAVDRLLQGDFAGAYGSNPLIVPIVLIAALMCADVLWYFWKQRRKNHE